MAAQARASSYGSAVVSSRNRAGAAATLKKISKKAQILMTGTRQTCTPGVSVLVRLIDHMQVSRNRWQSRELFVQGHGQAKTLVTWTAWFV